MKSSRMSPLLPEINNNLLPYEATTVRLYMLDNNVSSSLNLIKKIAPVQMSLKVHLPDPLFREIQAISIATLD